MRSADPTILEPFNLTASEAEAMLRDFLSFGEEYFQSNAATEDLRLLELDYSEQSVLEYLTRVIDHITFLNTPFADEAPDWVRNSQQARSGANLFSPDGAVWALRAAYYFGESLTRVGHHLAWGLGEKDTDCMNMPVVKGFHNQTEANVIQICRNLAMRVNIDRASFETVRVAVRYWFACASNRGT